MNWQKFAIASLIGGVIYFFLGWLVYGIILVKTMAIDPKYALVIERGPDDMKMEFMVISCLAWAAFITYIFMNWARISTAVSGAIAGATMGAWISLVFGASLIAMYRFGTPQNMIMDMIANAVCSAATGAGIAYYLGRK